MVKKILTLFFISCLLVSTVIGCKKDESKNSSPVNTTSSKASILPSASVNKSPVATAASTTTLSSTSSPASGNATASPGNSGPVTEYSIDLDFQIKTRVAGIVFGGIDDTSFLMWQINMWSYGDDPAKGLEEADKKVYLRPHIWNAGAVTVIDEVDISKFIKWEDRYKSHHIKITVNASNEVKTFINDSLVYTYTDPMAAYGLFGFRETSVVAAYFDNIVIKNTANNTIIFQEDFNKKVNPFPEGEIVSGEMGDSPAILMTALTGGPGEICVLQNG